MSFLSPSPTNQTSSDTMTERKEALKAAIHKERAFISAQELINQATSLCFKSCVPKPGNTLSRSEEKCLASCLDRYMEAFNVVSQTYHKRIMQEKQQHLDARETDTDGLL